MLCFSILNAINFVNALELGRDEPNATAATGTFLPNPGGVDGTIQVVVRTRQGPQQDGYNVSN